ncbi:MAG: hypothetical protein WC530_11075, partial [Candidatus Omnitrophota bacterium]
LAEEHPECLHSQCVRATLCASQRYLTADVRGRMNIPEKSADKAGVSEVAAWNKVGMPDPA